MRIFLLVLVFVVLIVAPVLGTHYQVPVTACGSNLKNLGTALEMYSTDHTGHFPTILSDVAPEYIKRIPTCPSTGRDTYSSMFVSSAAPDRYAVFCHGSNHLEQVPQNYPLYDSDEGLVRCDGRSATSCAAELRAMARAVDAFRRTHHGQLPTDASRLYPATKTHYRGERLVTQPIYQTDGRTYTVSCPIPEHLGAGIAPGYPRYDSTHGLVIKNLPPSESTPQPEMLDFRSLVSALCVLLILTALSLFRGARRFSWTGRVLLAAALALLSARPVFAERSGDSGRCLSNLVNIAHALEVYAFYHDGHYPERLDALVPTIFKRLPTCPAVGTDTYSATYDSGGSSGRWSLFCRGHNHLDRPPAYPRYDTVRGPSIAEPPPADQFSSNWVVGKSMAPRPSSQTRDASVVLPLVATIAVVGLLTWLARRDRRA